MSTLTGVVEHPVSPKKYKSFLKSMGLTQGIRVPTRITVTRSTIIDHVITNRNQLYSIFGVIPLGISDHDMVIVTRKKPKSLMPPTILNVGTTMTLIRCFQREIDELDWDVVLLCSDYTSLWNCLIGNS